MVYTMDFQIHTGLALWISMIKIHASMDSSMDIHVSCTDIYTSCMDTRVNEAWILGPGRLVNATGIFHEEPWCYDVIREVQLADNDSEPVYRANCNRACKLTDVQYSTPQTAVVQPSNYSSNGMF